MILSGGPARVFGADAPKLDARILELGLPVLGLCYGHQLIVHMAGGRLGQLKEENMAQRMLPSTSQSVF